MPFITAISVLYNWTRCPPAYHQPASDWSRSWAMLGILNQCRNCITFETCGILSPESAPSFPSFCLFLQDKGKYRNVVQQLCKHTAQRWQRCHTWPLNGRPAAHGLQLMREPGLAVGKVVHCQGSAYIKVWLSESQKHRSQGQPAFTPVQP